MNSTNPTTTTTTPDSGDILLRSLQGTTFPLHSYTLRTTSGLFRTIFTLPQPRTSTTPTEPTTIPIYESTSLLTQFLPLLTGRPPPKALHTLDLDNLTRLLVLAEKWDAPGPITYIRNVINASHYIDQHGSNAFFPYSPLPSIFSPEDGDGDGDGEEEFEDAVEEEESAEEKEERVDKLGPLTGFFRTDPVRVYVLARHFRWRAEAERAAVSLLALGEEELERRWADVRAGRRRVGYSFFEDEEEEEEGGEGGDRGGEEGKDGTMLMVTNQGWEMLVELRRRRCGRFKELIDSQERFTAGNNPNYTCIRCGHKLDNSPWNEFKKAMMAELESRPLGDTVLSAMCVPGPSDQPTDAWPELVSCFNAKCPGKECGASNYDSLATIKQIRKCVEELPWRLSL